MPSKRPWSQLPSEIVQLIADNLTDIADLFRFRSVCLSWRSPQIAVNLPPQLPWLLFPPNPFADRDDPRHFFSLSKNRVLPLHRLPSHARTLGSCSGWLLTVDGARSVLLLNPLTRTRTALPPLPDPFDSIPRSSIRRGKVSIFDGNSSNSSNFVVLASFWCSSTLALFKSGDLKWRFIIVDVDLSAGDFVYHKGKIFVFDKNDDVKVVNFDSLEVECVVPTSILKCSFHRRYLVETTTGDLLLVVRPSSMGKKFIVFRLDRICGRRLKWNNVWDIGDNMLFVDNEHAMCFAATDFRGFRANCIYFTGVYRVCLYCIWGGRVEQLTGYWERFPDKMELDDAVWFLPKLC